MRATIEIENKEEAKLIRKGLARDDVRALVKIMGALSDLEPESLVRVMKEVEKRLGEETLKRVEC